MFYGIAASATSHLVRLYRKVGHGPSDFMYMTHKNIFSDQRTLDSAPCPPFRLGGRSGYGRNIAPVQIKLSQIGLLTLAGSVDSVGLALGRHWAVAKRHRFPIPPPLGRLERDIRT